MLNEYLSIWGNCKALANQDEAVMTGVPPCKNPKNSYSITKIETANGESPMYRSQNFQPRVYRSVSPAYTSSFQLLQED